MVYNLFNDAFNVARLEFLFCLVDTHFRVAIIMVFSGALGYLHCILPTICIMSLIVGPLLN